MRLTPILATVAMTGALAGGGAAIANAATSTTPSNHTTSTSSTTTTTAPTRPAPQTGRSSGGSHHCPNM